MAVYGDLSTMPLPELLQWLGGNSKTGTLEVEKDRICKRITFRQGRVVATASNDPKELLGHFMVSRGQITEDLLRIALGQQETGGKPLGTTLVEMGALTTEEMVRSLSAKAEETLFSLFDWDEAVFRFRREVEDEDPAFPIEVRVEDILLRGMQRIDELRRIREVFNDNAIVPERTAKLPPPEVFRNRVARRIYESIDGERTVADILLHAHGSQYLVTKFLFELHRTGLIRILQIREAPTEDPSPATAAGAPAASTDEPHGNPSGSDEPTGTTAILQPSVPSGLPEVERRLAEATRLMSRGEYGEALDALDLLYADHPGNESLRRLSLEAEAAFLEKAYKHYVPADKMPALLQPVESLEFEDLSPKEVFMLSRLGGDWSVKEVIQIAPMREVDALRALKRMKERGIIELRDPD